MPLPRLGSIQCDGCKRDTSKFERSLTRSLFLERGICDGRIAGPACSHCLSGAFQSHDSFLFQATHIRATENARHCIELACRRRRLLCSVEFCTSYDLSTPDVGSQHRPKGAVSAKLTVKLMVTRFHRRIPSQYMIACCKRRCSRAAACASTHSGSTPFTRLKRYSATLQDTLPCLDIFPPPYGRVFVGR